MEWNSTFWLFFQYVDFLWLGERFKVTVIGIMFRRLTRAKKSDGNFYFTVIDAPNSLLTKAWDVYSEGRLKVSLIVGSKAESGIGILSLAQAWEKNYRQ